MNFLSVSFPVEEYSILGAQKKKDKNKKQINTNNSKLL